MKKSNVVALVLCAAAVFPHTAHAANEIPVQLRIENETATDLNVTIQIPDECDVVDTTTSTPSHFTGYKAICALQAAQDQGKLTYEVTNWGFAFALNRINTTINAADWSKTWLMFQNLKDPGMGIDGFSLQANDELLLTYTSWPTTPLRLEVNPSVAQAGDMVDIAVETWDGATGEFHLIHGTTSTIWIGGAPQETASGTVQWVVTAGDTPIYAEAAGATRSAISTFSAAAATPAPITPPDANSSSSGNSLGCSSCGISPTIFRVLNIPNAIAYLQNKQQPDGSILGSNLYSDWAAVAFASYNGQNNSKDTLKQYLLTDPSPIVGFNETADYARRAMALLALGINPYSGTPTNYIQKLVDKFDGTQFGEPSLVNDDIFALFPLLHAGYNSNDLMIVSTTAFIISKQDVNGSWGGVDVTAATIQALSPLSVLPNVSSAITAAKTYLHTQQQSNGSFGDNADSTSWTLQAITALGESDSAWTTQSTGNDYIAGKQMTDGGVGDTSLPDAVRVWSTAYAIPAAEGKTWDNILSSVAKPVSPPPVNNPGFEPISNPIMTATTTPIVATSTPAVATSTLPVVIIPVVAEVPVEVVAEPVVTPVVSKPKEAQVLGVKIVAEKNDVDTTVYSEVASSTAATAPPSKEQVVAFDSSTVPASGIAKNVFAGAVTLTGTIGLYLAWKFAKTLL